MATHFGILASRIPWTEEPGGLQTIDFQRVKPDSPRIFDMCVCAQSCLTLCDSLDCSLLGSSAHGISQARILEWVATSLSRGSSRPRDPAHISCTGRLILYHCGTREGHAPLTQAGKESTRESLGI